MDYPVKQISEGVEEREEHSGQILLGPQPARILLPTEQVELVQAGDAPTWNTAPLAPTVVWEVAFLMQVPFLLWLPSPSSP